MKKTRIEMSEAIRQPLLSSNSNSIQSKSVADDYDEPDPPKEEELDDGDEIGEHGHGHKGHKGIDHVCSEAKIAAAFVCQALLGGDHWDGNVLSQRKQRKMFLFYMNMTYVWNFILFIYMGLILFERPLWCYHEEVDCGLSEQYLPFPIPMMPTRASQFVELGCLIFLGFCMYCHYYFMGGWSTKSYFKDPWNILQLVVLLVATIDVLVSLFTVRHFILSAWCRPFLFIALCPSLRKSLIQMFRVMFDVAEVFFLIALLTLWFGWIFLILYRDSDEGVEYFPSFMDGIVNLIMTLTTDITPDVMLPALADQPGTIVIWMCFVCIGVFLLMNLVLASVFNSYKNQLVEDAEVVGRLRDDNVKRAFVELDTKKTGYVTGSQLTDLFKELNSYRLLPHIDLEHVNYYIQALDRQRNDQVEEKDFHDILNVVHTRIRAYVADTWLSKKFPSFYYSPIFSWFRTIVESRYFEYSIDIIISLNVILSIIETVLYDNDDDVSGSVLTGIEIAFTCVYLGEMLVKIGAHGWANYWKRYTNRFDFIITVASIVIQIVTLTTLADRTLARIVLLIRTMRLLRLLSNSKRFIVIASTFMKLIPAFTNLLGLMFVVLFFYALIGVQFFGGLIYVGNPALADTGYADDHYCSLNFNNFGSALILLFEMLIVSNISVLTGGLRAIVGWWAVVYYVSFWICAVLVVLNLLVAFILEAFIDQYDRQKHGELQTGKSRITTINGEQVVIETSKPTTVYDIINDSEEAK